MFNIYITDTAREQLNELKNNKSLSKKYKVVKKTIELLLLNPRHQSLQTHEFTTIKGYNGEKVFEAYVQQNTPGAYRIFWYYGPEKDEITIISIVPHP